MTNGVRRKRCHQQHLTISRYSACRRYVSHDLTVAAVHGEGNADLLSVPAEDLEHIRAPAHIACQGDNVPRMGTNRTSRIFLEQKMVGPHDPVYPFMVDPVVFFFNKDAVDNGGHPAVSEGGAVIGYLLNEGEINVVILSRTVAFPALLALILV